MTGKLSKNFHGVGIGPLSKIYAVKYYCTLESFSKFATVLQRRVTYSRILTTKVTVRA